MSTPKPEKHLGQVFLKNRSYLSKIIQAAELKPNDLVLEIGPGTGILTEALLKTGAQVIAVEKDPKLVEFLTQKFQNKKNLTLIQADIRDFLNNPQYTGYKIQNTEYKAIGNIPYYLTSHLIRLLLTLKNKPQIIVLMVQKEVAQRIVAQPPKMNLLALSVQFYSQPKLICFVPKSAFWPKPKVDSAIIQLTLHKTIKSFPPQLESLFFQLIKAGFSHPRKLLINNLEKNLKIPNAKLQQIFTKLNISLKTRPQELSLKTWLTLTKHLFA